MGFCGRDTMIIWTGWGFLVLVFLFAASFLMNLITDWQFGEGYYHEHLWAFGIALILGGVISSAVGFFLKKRNDREVIDVKTGERMIVNMSQHSIFFVPMHWAGIVLVFLGIGTAIYNLLR